MTDPLLDLLGPHPGPCGICGGPDARHRMADAIVERVQAGEPAERVAADYGRPIEVVEALVAGWPG